MQSHVTAGNCCTPSPRGDTIAFTRNSSILKLNFLDRHSHLHDGGVVLPRPEVKVRSLKWSADGTQVLVVHEKGVTVAECDESCVRTERASIERGSGGLGQITSANFIGNDHVLACWEFGKTKLWSMNTGKSLDLPDIKTGSDGQKWHSRPGKQTPGLFALLSRIGAEDHLVLQFSFFTQHLAPVKLPTLDAQSISWSPDGRWLAILDVPSASPSLHIYTPDGHRFRSYPSNKDLDTTLGVKSISWSPGGRLMALAKHDGRVELLNTRTFSPLAVIEHNTTIDQREYPSNQQAPVWQEQASVTNSRSYSRQSQPVSPPLTKITPSIEPKDAGVADAIFNNDGTFLATRDCRMLNTVWIWNMATLAAHAVVIQHSNVRGLQWHPTKAEMLLIDCAEGLAHVYDVQSSSPPVALSTGMKAKALLSWIHSASDAKPIIMVTERSRFRTLHLGCDPDEEGGANVSRRAASTRPISSLEGDEAEGEEEDDSLMDILSSRKPLPPKTEPSYTEMIDLDVEAEETSAGILEDTFREKRRYDAAEPDPFDDSEIF